MAFHIVGLGVAFILFTSSYSQSVAPCGDVAREICDNPRDPISCHLYLLRVLDEVNWYDETGKCKQSLQNTTAYACWREVVTMCTTSHDGYELVDCILDNEENASQNCVASIDAMNCYSHSDYDSPIQSHTDSDFDEEYDGDCEISINEFFGLPGSLDFTLEENYIFGRHHSALSPLSIVLLLAIFFSVIGAYVLHKKSSVVGRYTRINEKSTDMISVENSDSPQSE